ncbi:hypothetical protein SUDANB58_00535 [Streptomyces sp. enrichment culture]|uniref:DUF6332 family protein n=1 Tax=Streptomyces sp. enrichment culture TaxID=1795815 RepID=UPI003F55C1C6
MEHHGGRRSRAERDAVTVEIGYALFSAAFAAAVLFGAVAGPAYVFDLPAGARNTLIGCGRAVAAVVFVVRVVGVLVRFRRSAQAGRTGPGS